MSNNNETGGERLPAWRRWAALVVLSLTLFISAVDLLIVNAALGPIAADLNTGLDELAWVVSGFTLALGSWPLAAGAIGERIGRKPLILIGLTVFGVASLFAAMAESATALIAARYAMGLGIGIVMPNAVGTIRGMFSGRQLHTALAIWAAAAGLGVVTGPLAGGLLLRHFDWGSIFLVNVPFVAIALIAGAVLIPETRTPGGRRLDVVGVVLSVAAISLLVWAIIEAPERGWTTTTIIAAFATFAVLAAAWIAWERRTGEPMVELAWFRNGAISGAVAALACAYGALLGALFLVTVWLQAVAGYDSLQTGVRLLPVAGALLVSTVVAVSLSERHGARWVIASGLGLIGAGVGVFAGIDEPRGYGSVALSLCLCGAGLGATLAPAQHLIVASVAERYAAIGTSLGDTARYVGAALGLAVAASLFSTRYDAVVEPVLAEPPLDRLPEPTRAAVGDSVFSAAEAADRIGGPLGDLVRESAVTAGFLAGLGPAGVVASAVAIAGALVAIKLIPGRRPGASPEAGERDAAAADAVDLDQEDPAALADVVVGFANKPGLLVVLNPLGGSGTEAAEGVAALVDSVTRMTRAGAEPQRVMVAVARHSSEAPAGDRVAVSTDTLPRIRAAAASSGIGEIGEVLIEPIEHDRHRGLRALVGATPEAGLEEVALGRAFEACAEAVAKAVPELSEVLVCREIALSSG